MGQIGQDVAPVITGKGAQDPNNPNGTRPLTTKQAVTRGALGGLAKGLQNQAQNQAMINRGGGGGMIQTPQAPQVSAQYFQPIMPTQPNQAGFPQGPNPNRLFFGGGGF